MGSRLKQTFLEWIRYVVFRLTMVFYIIACTVIVPIVYCVYLAAMHLGADMQKFRKYIGRIWLECTKACLYIVVGHNITVVYDPKAKNNKGKGIILPNHITYLDWMYVWTALLEMQKDTIVFVSKKDIQAAFFLLPGIKMLNFVLIDRDKTKDANKLAGGAKHLIEEDNSCIVVFAEGTFIDRKTSQSAKDYVKTLKDNQEAYNNLTSAEKATAPKPKDVPPITYPGRNIILPRTVGMEIINKAAGDKLDYVMNCTLYVPTPNKEYASNYYDFRRLMSGQGSDISTLLICDYEDISQSPSGSSKKRNQFRENTAGYLYNQFEKKDKELETMKHMSRKELTEHIKTTRPRHIISKPTIHLGAVSFIMFGTFLMVFGASFLIWACCNRVFTELSNRHIFSPLFTMGEWLLQSEAPQPHTQTVG
ncbi:hypothetical protein NECID01_1863 [Nematocida sp. AWRm77]|nr:hypothetical protein NECID01_1863 [Nematocida sp. AWRm77]